MIICDYFKVIDDYLWLWYVSVVCIDEGPGELFFAREFKKTNIIGLKTINEWYKQCKKLQIFIFSKKIKKLKDKKNGKKKCARTLIYTYYYFHVVFPKLNYFKVLKYRTNERHACSEVT